MPGIRTTTASLLFCCALSAQTVWMPLDEGNVWVYRSAGNIGASTLEVRVEKTAEFSPGTFALVKGFPQGEVWLRNSEDGRLMMWDEKTGKERVWLDTAAKEGAVSESGTDFCTTSSTVDSRQAKYSGPLGDFNYALHIRYLPGKCMDAGLESDYLLPWIGIVSRTYQSIAGPRRYDLIYARLGTATVLSPPEAAFSLSIDRHEVWANLMPPIDPRASVPVLNARMVLRNTTGAPLTLDFTSGQEFEMVLWNEKGEQVWHWSDGRMFTAALHSISLRSGDRVWTESIRLGDPVSGRPLPAGRYVLECWLTSTLGRTFTASVPLVLAHAN
jgi:hypothetical protein